MRTHSCRADGKKIEKALAHFQIDPAGLTVMDVGASTGGFTDCLLRRGPPRCIRSTWLMANWLGACGRTRALNVWSGRIFDMSRRTCWRSLRRSV